jgi:ribonuclease P protein component
VVLFLKDDHMKKINILKNSRDFDRIIKNNKPYKYKDYIIFIERNTNDVHKFGLSVGKKIGNAVNRNKVKRQLKSIIDKKDYQNNFNCIIIVGKGINEKTFKEREDNLLFALNKLNIIKEKDDEEK